MGGAEGTKLDIDFVEMERVSAKIIRSLAQEAVKERFASFGQKSQLFANVCSLHRILLQKGAIWKFTEDNEADSE